MKGILWILGGFAVLYLNSEIGWPISPTICTVIFVGCIIIGVFSFGGGATGSSTSASKPVNNPSRPTNNSTKSAQPSSQAQSSTVVQTAAASQQPQRKTGRTPATASQQPNTPSVALEKKTCPHCGAEVQPGEIFCAECGYEI